MNCNLIGITGIIIQIFQFILTILVVYMKRTKEKPKRKIKIFILDISKQLLGSIIIHYVNLIFSVIYGNNSHSNQCSWYNSSILIDTTFGIIIDYYLLLILTKLITHLCPMVK